jgi:hypothetical protein
MGGEWAFAPAATLMRFGCVLALFVIVLLFARHRWVAREEERRLRGILLSASVSILGFILFFGGPLAIFAPFLLIFVGQFLILYLLLPAFAAAVLADLGLRALGAQRTRIWLVAGMALAVAIAFLWLQVVFQGQDLLLRDGVLEAALEYAFFALVPVSTALTWWSYLPLTAEGFAGTFG